MKIKNYIALSLSAVFAAAVFSGDAQARTGELSFHNTHTGENLTANPDTDEGRRAINHILRDHRRNREANINPRLLDLLQKIEGEIERRHPGLNVVFHIISGYRSPETNENLRKTRGGQAKNSQHMHANAIDIRVPGISTKELRDIAWCAQGGGVGYYPKSSFVHVDVAKIRTWPGAWETGVKCK